MKCITAFYENKHTISSTKSCHPTFLSHGWKVMTELILSVLNLSIYPHRLTFSSNICADFNWWNNNLINHLGAWQTIDWKQFWWWHLSSINANVSEMWEFAFFSISYNWKLNICVFWTVGHTIQSLWRCHLWLWYIILDVFQQFYKLK